MLNKQYKIRNSKYIYIFELTPILKCVLVSTIFYVNFPASSSGSKQDWSHSCKSFGKLSNHAHPLFSSKQHTINHINTVLKTKLNTRHYIIIKKKNIQKIKIIHIQAKNDFQLHQNTFHINSLTHKLHFTFNH